MLYLGHLQTHIRIQLNFYILCRTYWVEKFGKGKGETHIPNHIR